MSQLAHLLLALLTSTSASSHLTLEYALLCRLVDLHQII